MTDENAANVNTDDRSNLLAWIRDHGGVVTPRDLARGPRQYRGEIERAEIALQDLVTDGLGIWEVLLSSEAGGRPTRVFRLQTSGDETSGDETSPVAAVATGQVDRTDATDGDPNAIIVPAEQKTLVTRAQILAGVESLEREVTAWREQCAAERRKPWVTSRRFPLSRDFESAVSQIVELLDTPHVERDAWPLVLAFDSFVAAMGDLARQNGGTLLVDPDQDSLLTWFDSLVAAKTPRERRDIESPQVLAGQGLDHRAIARQFKWFQPNGVPDLSKVREELAQPGRHFHQEDFQHPRDRKYEEDLERQWQKRCRAIELRKPAAPPKPVRERKPARETLDELLEQRVDPRQIAKMKLISVEEVYSRANLLGLDVGEPVRHRTFMDAQRAREARRKAELQRGMELAKLDNHQEVGTDRDERIRRMLCDGVRIRDVRDVLSRQFPYLRIEDVEAIADQLAKERVEASSPVPETV